MFICCSESIIKKIVINKFNFIFIFISITDIFYMIKIIIGKGESLEKALKRYKHKVIKTKQIEELRARQEFVKKTTLKREQMKKAKYKQQIAQKNID